MNLRILTEEVKKTHWKRTHCEAEVQEPFGRNLRHADIAQKRKCRMLSVYELDGRKLCDRHCGDELIRRALKGEIK